MVQLAPALIFGLAGGAHAGGFKVIHSFTGADGAYPERSGVAPAPHGGFYVAAISGGAFGDGALTLGTPLRWWIATLI